MIFQIQLYGVFAKSKYCDIVIVLVQVVDYWWDPQKRHSHIAETTSTNS